MKPDPTKSDETVETPPDFDLVFEALASAHRRDIVFALALQPHSISQLAVMRHLSLPAIHKHIKLLEEARLVQRRKVGRTNVLTVRRESLLALQEWLGQFNAYWGSDAESLQNYEAFLTKQQNNKETP